MVFLSTQKLAGPGYVVLNALRIMNIVGLLAVICASLVMIVKTHIDSQFFFFEAVGHITTASISVFLVTTEVGVFSTWFDRNWPLFSIQHGLVTLGLSMVALGAVILGNLNRPDAAEDRLGLAFWRIVVASGIVVIILGVFNIIANYIFRDHVSGVSARQVRAYGAVAIAEGRAQAQAEARGKVFMASSQGSEYDASSTPRFNNEHKAEPVVRADPVTPENRRQQPRKSFRFTRFGLPILPSYRDAASVVAPSSKYSGDEEASIKGSTTPPPRGINISGPMNINPQFAHLIKPDNAYHPAHAY